jgi:hypothetical protein
MEAQKVKDQLERIPEEIRERYQILTDENSKEIFGN